PRGRRAGRPCCRETNPVVSLGTPKAEVVELADTRCSGRRGLTPVWVRLPPSAHPRTTKPLPGGKGFALFSNFASCTGAVAGAGPAGPQWPRPVLFLAVKVSISSS